MPGATPWWKSAVFYQIYPRSFADSDGDGVGDLEGIDRLLAEAHDRGIRVIVDWVPNHTSDQHPWFVEARASRDSPKRDWYIWHDGGAGPGGRPNNWKAAFGGDA